MAKRRRAKKSSSRTIRSNSTDSGSVLLGLAVLLVLIAIVSVAVGIVIVLIPLVLIPMWMILQEIILSINENTTQADIEEMIGLYDLFYNATPFNSEFKRLLIEIPKHALKYVSVLYQNITIRLVTGVNHRHFIPGRSMVRIRLEPPQTTQSNLGGFLFCLFLLIMMSSCFD